MKHPHLQDYRPEHTQLCEAALLTVWDILDDYRDDLVLIGGLVPRFICKPPREELAAGTLDVDLGIAVGVRGTAHQRIASRLGELGFVTKPPQLPPGASPLAKFYRTYDAMELGVEFLADRPTPESPAIVTLDNMAVPAIPGIGSALARKRAVPIEGRTLQGGESRQRVSVCDVGPFLCLKLQAYATGGAERAGKDVFDVVHSVIHYAEGADAALAGFAAELGVNPAWIPSVRALRKGFGHEPSAAAIAYAEFCLGGLRGSGPVEDFDFRYAQRLQEAALVGGRLLQAAEAGSSPSP
jgi:hypothetical protein